MVNTNHLATHQRGWIPWNATITLFIFFTVLSLILFGGFVKPTVSNIIDPLGYAARTKRILSSTPLIDGHNDLPYLIRRELKNQIYGQKFTSGLRNGLLSHTDIRKLRIGGVGGQFWSVYVPCPEESVSAHAGPETSLGLDAPTWAVRDTLEQIDITKRLIEEFPETFAFCGTASCIKKRFSEGKISSMIGIEGGHQVGNSLANIRQMFDLGARYITTTHNCDNVFATAASTVAAAGPDFDYGLTEFGKEYVIEMNRIGMMIDLAHVSHKTMVDVLAIARAPAIFSHSSSYAIHPHLRNVPDYVLRLLKNNGGIIMVTFVPKFLTDSEQATVHDVVKHILHIVDIIGWDYIGLGSDFDGTDSTPLGIEDVSMYPNLLQLLMEQGATDHQIAKLAGENLVRVWTEVENVARKIQSSGEKPNEEYWAERVWEIDADPPFMFLDESKKLHADGNGTS